MSDVKCKCGATIYSHNANRGMTVCFDCRKRHEENKMTMDMNELWAQATDAFYEWEEATGQEDLGDEERLIWCEGYIYCKQTRGE